MAEIYKPESAEMAKTWNPQEVEDKLYREWEENGYFTAHRVEGKKPFTIVMPPPNITGQLHMGHALDAMLQDVPTRYHRMKGDPTLWLPGTDHASIATEVKIVDQLKAEGLTKQQIGREEFLKRAWDWKKKYADRITLQQRKLGASCDWTRQRFTMDEGCSKAVNEVFVRLYEKGLIYRGERIINWCPVCKTALSDAEVEYEEQDSHLWYIRYPAADGGEGVIVATTRPETMLGDTGVAVNPEDERYKDLIGKNLMLPIMNREIPVVADEYVEKEFGTGAVKMTPAHDPNDFEVARRHNLKLIRVIADDGTMNENAGEFKGMTREDCRKAVCERLEQMGLMVKIENYKHNVGTCYRCHTTVEPLASNQWFVKMQPLAEPAIEAVRKGETKFIPERFTKTYFNWMDNIRDWCISRQLWWGHRIPAYYLPKGGYVVAESKEEALKLAQAKADYPIAESDLRQDEDCLDTWFSSWLWPISLFDGINNPGNEEIKYYYPTSDLVTGPDIIFFWVARMIMAGYEYEGKMPFKNVYFTGIVRDKLGRKMSKQLGNSPDPLELIAKYGADGVRMGMMLSAPAGNDILFDDSLCEQGRNFNNKIWNAFRLVKGWQVADIEQPKECAQAIEWFAAVLRKTQIEVADLFSKYRLSEALMAVYKLFWDEFSAWYLEMVKPEYGKPIDSKTLNATLDFFEQLLLLLHPFMPFITEELWQNIFERKAGESIMVAQVATPEPQAGDDALIAKFEAMKAVVAGVRSVRNQRNFPPKKELDVVALGQNPVCDMEGLIKWLGFVSGVKVVSEKPASAVSFMVGTTEFAVPIGDLIDKDAEIAKNEAEIKRLQGFLAGVRKKLSNEKFVAGAPQQVVEMERKKEADAMQKIAQLEESLANLRK